MADRVEEILSYYSSDNPGTKTVMGIYAGEVQ